MGRVFHRMMPDTSERLFPSTTHKALIDDAPLTTATAGSLHEPMSSGTEVSGGVKKRMAAEQKAPDQERL